MVKTVLINKWLVYTIKSTKNLKIGLLSGVNTQVILYNAFKIGQGSVYKCNYFQF